VGFRNVHQWWGNLFAKGRRARWGISRSPVDFYYCVVDWWVSRSNLDLLPASIKSRPPAVGSELLRVIFQSYPRREASRYDAKLQHWQQFISVFLAFTAISLPAPKNSGHVKHRWKIFWSHRVMASSKPSRCPLSESHPHGLIGQDQNLMQEQRTTTRWSCTCQNPPKYELCKDWEYPATDGSRQLQDSSHNLNSLFSPVEKEGAANDN